MLDFYYELYYRFSRLDFISNVDEFIVDLIYYFKSPKNGNILKIREDLNKLSLKPYVRILKILNDTNTEELKILHATIRSTKGMHKVITQFELLRDNINDIKLDEDRKLRFKKSLKRLKNVINEIEDRISPEGES